MAQQMPFVTDAFMSFYNCSYGYCYCHSLLFIARPKISNVFVCLARTLWWTEACPVEAILIKFIVMHKLRTIASFLCAIPSTQPTELRTFIYFHLLSTSFFYSIFFLLHTLPNSKTTFYYFIDFGIYFHRSFFLFFSLSLSHEMWTLFPTFGWVQCVTFSCRYSFFPSFSQYFSLSFRSTVLAML